MCFPFKVASSPVKMDPLHPYTYGPRAYLFEPITVGMVWVSFMGIGVNVANRCTEVSWAPLVRVQRLYKLCFESWESAYFVYIYIISVCIYLV